MLSNSSVLITFNQPQNDATISYYFVQFLLFCTIVTYMNINIEYWGQTEQKSVASVASVDLVMIAPHQVTIMSW